MNILLFNENSLPLQIPTPEALPNTGFIWIDCQPEELSQALPLINRLTNITLDDRHIEDCLNPSHPCFFDSMQDYDLLIFRDLTNPDKTSEIVTNPVTFLLFEKILLTVNNNDNAIAKIRNRALEVGRRQPSQPNILLLLILNAIIDNFLTLRTTLTAQLTNWQTQLLDEKKTFNQWNELLDFKTNLSRLYILCEEQQDALGKWRQNMEEDLPQNISVRLNDLSNHISRVLRHTQLLESELETLMELNYTITTKHTNEVIRVLTVIFSIFLPMTLITGIYGMNFHSMAGLNNPWGFYITLAAMVTLAILLVGIFRWIRWI